MKRTHAIGFGLATWVSLCVGGTALAQDAAPPICGPEIKFEVLEAMAPFTSKDGSVSKEAASMEKKLYEQYAYCADDGAPTHDEERDHYCGKLVTSGSTFYESMPCCGYDPQKKLFACPVEIRQSFGFGPAHFPGSFEHVLTCVDFGSGFEPVAFDSVHLADEIYGKSPDWYFAVIARAWDKLAQQSLKGQTLQARSILSWELRPDHCKYRPIWGNMIDYQIRLDP